MPTIAPGNPPRPLPSEFSLPVETAKNQQLKYDASKATIQRIPCSLDIKPANIKQRAPRTESEGIVKKRRLRGEITREAVLAAVRQAGEPVNRHEVEARLVGRVGAETVKLCLRDLVNKGKLVVTRDKKPGAKREMKCYAIVILDDE